MTNEEKTLALDYLEKMQKTYVDGEGYEVHPLPEWYALEAAIKALEQQPCEDCISREAVLELAKRGILVSNDNYKCVVNAIKSLPPVTLQRPKGKWITQAYSMRITCTNCEKEIWYSGRNDYKYCPNCGADMSGGAE